MASTHLSLASSSPPGPAREYLLGSSDETLELLLRWFVEFGNTYRVRAPDGRCTWVIHDPEDVRRVLVSNHRNYTKGLGLDRVRLLLGRGIMTSEGELWRRQRRMVQPAFHRKGIERFGAIIHDCNELLMAHWQQAAAAERTINLTRSTSEFTLNVMLRSIFSEDLDALVANLQDNPFMMVADESRRDPLFAYRFRQLGTLGRDLLRRRRSADLRRADLMQMLMEARDPDTGRGMEERQLVDEILTLVVAGHETTASTLNSTWWLLSQHPDIEARLHAEQDREGDLGPIDYPGLGRLPFTRQVLDEVLRLYPAGWALTRRSIGPDRLGGYELPAGTDIVLSPYVIHRHPDYWLDAERFDPERFAADAPTSRERRTYIPFAVGPRHCIGEYFAIYEMMLHLNGATRRFRLRPATDEPVSWEARINLRTARDLHMRVERR
jgi:cytochrome P450